LPDVADAVMIAATQIRRSSYGPLASRVVPTEIRSRQDGGAPSL
jgi:hypothetical protein